MNQNNKSGLHIFMCYASEDKQSVLEIYHQLKKEGFTPWLDEEELLPGQDYDLIISKVLKQSHIIIVFLSNKSIMKSGHIQKEIKIALDLALNQPEEAIFIIPLKLEECEIPDSLKKRHYSNYFEKNGYEKLLRSLYYRAAQLNINIRKKDNTIISNVENKVENSHNDVLHKAQYKLQSACKNLELLTWEEFSWISNLRKQLYVLLDPVELAFALSCSLQHGKNLPFWSRINLNNVKVVDVIIEPILENRGRRPLLRAGYVLEKSSNELKEKTISRIRKYVDSLAGNGNDIPKKIIDAACENRTYELWKNDLIKIPRYGSIINKLIQEISEPDI